jgi:hypothetical protein
MLRRILSNKCTVQFGVWLNRPKLPDDIDKNGDVWRFSWSANVAAWGVGGNGGCGVPDKYSEFRDFERVR